VLFRYTEICTILDARRLVNVFGIVARRDDCQYWLQPWLMSHNTDIAQTSISNIKKEKNYLLDYVAIIQYLYPSFTSSTITTAMNSGIFRNPKGGAPGVLSLQVYIFMLTIRTNVFTCPGARVPWIRPWQQWQIQDLPKGHGKRAEREPKWGSESFLPIFIQKVAKS